jgi:hypothetical protein
VWRYDGGVGCSVAGVGCALLQLVRSPLSWGFKKEAAKSMTGRIGAAECRVRLINPLFIVAVSSVFF